MSEGSKLHFYPLRTAARPRAAYFEAAYLKQLEVNKALTARDHRAGDGKRSQQ